MITLFFLPGFEADSVRLQPWLTVRQVGQRLAEKGHDVHVITTSRKTVMDGITIHSTQDLPGARGKGIRDLIRSIRPDVAVVTVTPLSLIGTPWYSVLEETRAYAFCSYPFYTIPEISAAFSHIGWSQRYQYGRHLLVPTTLWGGRLARFFKDAICQSRKTAHRLETATGGLLRVHVIPPGINPNLANSEISSADGNPERQLLYLGASLEIRGLGVLLHSLRGLHHPDVRVRILARGANAADVRAIERRVALAGIEIPITVEGGWLTPKELAAEVSKATFVVFPFVLVPSELPVSIMEVVYLGTPVIVTDLDGLPEAAGRGGLVIRNGNAEELRSAITSLFENETLLDDLRKGCLDERQRMLSWDSRSEEWDRALRG